MRAGRLIVAAMVATAALAGCTLVKNEERDSGTQSGVDVFFEDENFNPDKMAADLWDSQVIPYLADKAGSLEEILPLMAEDPEAAGARFGHREQAEAPWTVATRVEGTIVAAKTDTRAATIDIDVDGDAAADAQVQIGPVVRGTALRDILDFVPFGSFTNQIDYAQFGKSLNRLMSDAELADVPREDLVGRTVELLGVFPLDDSQAPPIITVAEISVGEKAP